LDKPYWYELFEDPILRQYFSDICKAFTRIPEFQEDLYQEAWLRVGQCEEGLDLPYYMHEGFKAMNRYYIQEWRSWRLIRQGKGYKPYREPCRKRVERARKKFKKNVRKVAQTRK